MTYFFTQRSLNPSATSWANTISGMSHWTFPVLCNLEVVREHWHCWSAFPRMLPLPDWEPWICIICFLLGSQVRWAFSQIPGTCNFARREGIHPLQPLRLSFPNYTPKFPQKLIFLSQRFKRKQARQEMQTVLKKGLYRNYCRYFKA